MRALEPRIDLGRPGRARAGDRRRLHSVQKEDTSRNLLQIGRMVRDPLWWFAITAVGWALAIASCWSARTLVPFVVLAGMAIGQGLLLGKQVKPWVWATLSFVANSVALGLFLLGFAQLYRGNSIRTYALMFALPL